MALTRVALVLLHVTILRKVQLPPGAARGYWWLVAALGGRKLVCSSLANWSQSPILCVRVEVRLPTVL